MLTFLILLLALYLLALRCRSGHPGWSALLGWDYAHRGLHGNGLPENSMAAFRAALEGGYGVELDIHLLADGNLAVVHDSALKRTTGLPGRIEDLTTGDLKHCCLEGTTETIPEFMDVLTLFNGKAPIIVELKSVDGNHAALAEAACKMLESYRGVFCMESFDPRCVYWLRKNRPDIIRGQLTENFFRSSQMSPVLKFLLTHSLTNFLTQPDFVAYNFYHRADSISNVLCRKLWKARMVGWTIKEPETHREAKREGWISIFEGFRPDGSALKKAPAEVE